MGVLLKLKWMRGEQVLGTHNGAIFILDSQGAIVKRFRPHRAMINDLSIDLGSDFVATASMDGKAILLS